MVLLCPIMSVPYHSIEFLTTANLFHLVGTVAVSCHIDSDDASNRLPLHDNVGVSFMNNLEIYTRLQDLRFASWLK